MKRLMALAVGLAVVVAPGRPAGVLVTDQGILPAASNSVFVKIVTQVARTTVTQTFRNQTDHMVRGAYSFPLPDPATLVGLTKIEGDRRTPRPLEVRESPGTAAPGGPGVRGTIPIDPIAAGESVTLELVYEEVLPYSDGQIRYALPLASARTGAAPLQAFRLTTAIADQRGVLTLRSPTHSPQIRYNPSGFWNVSLETDSLPAAPELVIDYDLRPDAMSVALVGGRDRDERDNRGDGSYVLALLSPRESAPMDEVAAKEVIFLLDLSGSMAGEKLSMAKSGFAKCIERLNPQDRFNVITFSSGCDRLWDARRPATPENKVAARKWVERLVEGGGTNLFGALEQGLADLEKADGARYLYLLTDGNPTAGLTDADEIVERFHRQNKRDARLFAFGVGDDVTGWLLDRLALRSRGDVVYVAPGAALEEQVARLFRRIARPLLVDPRVSFQGLRVADVYPETLSDLYQGSQVIVVARVLEAPAGKATMTLSGRVGTKSRSFRYDVPADFMQRVSRAVPRLWARGRVDHLMRRIRTEGETSQLKQAVIAIATQHRLATPYTAYAASGDRAPTSPPDPAGAPFSLAQRASGSSPSGTGYGPSGALVTISRTVVERPEPYVLKVRGGLLGLVFGTRVRSARVRANTRACFANQTTIAGAMEMYNLDKNTRVTDLSPALLSVLKSGGYLQSIPQDPGQGSGSELNYRSAPHGNGVFCVSHGPVGEGREDEPLPSHVEVDQPDGTRTLQPARYLKPGWHALADLGCFLADVLLSVLQFAVLCWMIGPFVRSARPAEKVIGS